MFNATRSPFKRFLVFPSSDAKTDLFSKYIPSDFKILIFIFSSIKIKYNLKISSPATTPLSFKNNSAFDTESALINNSEVISPFPTSSLKACLIIFSASQN